MPIAAKVPKTVATAPELKATIKLLRREFHNGAESKINFSYHTKERNEEGGTRMIDGNRTYIAIDLKSFYASVECVERGLDPLTTNLVVADAGRTEKTICLAVSPSLKAYGIPGRARLFEVVQKVKQVKH